MNRISNFPASGAEHGIAAHGCASHGCNEAPARESSFNGPITPPELSNSISVEAGRGAVDSLSPTAMLSREIPDWGALHRPLETAAANPFPQSDDSNPPSPATEGVCISAPESSTLPGAEAPTAPSTFNGSTESLPTHQPTADEIAEAQDKARLCEDFVQLTREGYSLNQASAALGKSPSWFSGADSPFARWRRDGEAGLLPQRRRAGAKAGDLSKAVEGLPWFIPAAKFFYLLTNRTESSGSVPEAIRRTISLPECPAACVTGLLRKLTLETLPTCPAELREALLARERAGKPFLPERLMRLIAADARTVRQYRNPTEAGLYYLNAPGSIMWTPGENGDRRFTRAGDWIEADDGTINFPVCIPWTMGGCPTSDKFGVKVGRFQFLRPIDAGSRFRPGFLYVARPRGSYRREDVLALMRLVCRAHGVPRGWRFERGTWESNMVKEAVRLLGSQLHTVYSPRQKPFVEGGFNQDWTKLSVHFPNADVGRFMGETEEANLLLTAAKQGRQDPRKHFPMLDEAIAAFNAITAEENRTPVNSANWGRWIPEERWQAQLAENPLRRLAVESEWIFHPYVREWTVRGMQVGGKVPIFEEVSVPFDFAATWLGMFDGAKVRCHFDPTEARCIATIVLLQDWGTRKRGEVLGTAQQINETTGYVRFVMGWADDPASLGRKLRQQTASAMRREVRAILPNGRKAGGESEMRDGLGQKAVIQHDDTTFVQPGTRKPANMEPGAGSADEAASAPPTFDRAAVLREQDAREAAMSHLFD